MVEARNCRSRGGHRLLVLAIAQHGPGRCRAGSEPGTSVCLREMCIIIQTRAHAHAQRPSLAHAEQDKLARTHARTHTGRPSLVHAEQDKLACTHACIQVDGRLDWRSTSVTMDGQERKTKICQAGGAGQAGSCNSREGGAREYVTEQSRRTPPLGAESGAGVLPVLDAGEHTCAAIGGGDWAGNSQHSLSLTVTISGGEGGAARSGFRVTAPPFGHVLRGGAQVLVLVACPWRDRH